MGPGFAMRLLSYKTASGIATTVRTTDVKTTAATSHDYTINTGAGGKIAVAVTARSGGAGRTISSVVFDPAGANISATARVQVNNAGAGTTVRSEIWSATGIASSASMTLRITFAGGSCVSAITVYELVGASSATATAVNNNTANATSVSTSLSYSAGGVVIACACSEGGTVTHTWSGGAGLSSADYAATPDAGNAVTTSFSHKDEASAGTTQTVVDTLSGSSQVALAVAAFA